MVIKVHKMVLQWSKNSKASLISRVFTSTEYFEDFQRYNTMLSDCINDLNNTIATYHLLDSLSRPEPVDKAATEAELQSAIKRDMQV